MEQEYHVGKVIRFEPDAGKTGKGILHFWTVDLSSHTRLGQYRAVDLEDVVAVNSRPTKR